MDNLILKRRTFVAEQIQKSFDNDIEKAAHGVYEDNAENRRLNRVGQEYGHAAKEGEPAAAKRGNGDEPKSVGDLVKQRAAEASTEALKRAAADDKAKPEVREAAKKELESRDKKEDERDNVGSEKKMKKQSEKKDDYTDTDAILAKMTFNSNEVRWPADLDIESVQEKYDFDIDDVYLDEKKNQYIGYASRVSFDSTGRPHSKPFEAESELYDAYSNAVKKMKKAANKESSQGGGEDKEVEEQSKSEERIENQDSDFTEEDAKRFEELDYYINDPKERYSDKWYDSLQEYRDLRERSFNHELKENGQLNLDDFKDVKGIGTIHVNKTSNGGKDIQQPYISITLNKKKDVSNFIKDVKSKLGIELTEENFEFFPRDRYSGSYYQIAVNPETKEFDTDSKIANQIKDTHIKKQREAEDAERLAKRKQTMNSLKNSNSFSKESVEKLLDNDETKGHAFSYFNYGDDDECTPDEIEQFEKLEKMGAKVSDYFDWKEDDEAETYEKKMKAKGYRLFDISTDDGYMWLLIKNNKLDKGGEIKKSLDSVADLIEEIAGNK